MYHYQNWCKTEIILRNTQNLTKKDPQALSGQNKASTKGQSPNVLHRCHLFSPMLPHITPIKDVNIAANILFLDSGQHWSTIPTALHSAEQHDTVLKTEGSLGHLHCHKGHRLYLILPKLQVQCMHVVCNSVQCKQFIKVQ